MVLVSLVVDEQELDKAAPAKTIDKPISFSDLIFLRTSY